MHDIDYYRQRFILEAGLTRFILEQLRPALLDYRPHPSRRQPASCSGRSSGACGFVSTS